MSCAVHDNVSCHGPTASLIPPPGQFTTCRHHTTSRLQQDFLGLGDLSKPHKTKKETAIQRVTKDTTMKPVKDRLVRKALAVAAEKVQQKNEQKKKKKPSNKKQKALADLASSLQTLITGKTTAGTSASSKKKKRRRKTLPDGTIESWSVSSSASSETDQAEESDSEMDLETPVRKKSRDHPGSILRMLTDHVRETLEQGATTSLTEAGSSVTSGVKVMTYFMLHLRPSFNTYLKEMREMHHIAQEGGHLKEMHWRPVSWLYTRACWIRIGPRRGIWRFFQCRRPVLWVPLWFWQHANTPGLLPGWRVARKRSWKGFQGGLAKSSRFSPRQQRGKRQGKERKKQGPRKRVLGLEPTKQRMEGQQGETSREDGLRDSLTALAQAVRGDLN